MDTPAHAAALRREASRADERRLLVLAGDRSEGFDVALAALAAAGLADGDVAVVTDREGVGGERFDPADSADLLGTTRDAVVLDAHAGFAPNVLGRVVGAVDGGGLLFLLVPPLADWSARTTDFDRTLAVPPFDADDVTGRFRRRLVRTLHDHPGVSVVDLSTGALASDGRTEQEAVDGDPDAVDPPTADPPTADVADGPPAAGRPERSVPSPPRNGPFPTAAYEASLTADQFRALRALERLRDPGNAVVVEADRGRGKSAAAGLAAGSLAAEGRDVLVTAPDRRGAGELLDWAAALLRETDELTAASDDALRAASGGRVRYLPPTEAAALPDDPDAVVVDEAAGLPVGLLDGTLDAPAVAYVTTVHGYEGAGRGFSVRFRDRLDAADRDVTDVTLDAPIRYARDDPVEAWAFRALALDARPAVDPAVADATPGSVSYVALDPEDLLADEHLLREAFGLLALAHYRTEPDDLARLLDAPNVAVRALSHEGHVVSVALLAREGGLDADTRAAMYEGERIRGNMLPDVLTSQLRDEDAGVPVGHRILRIATHGAVRSRGLGSRLLDSVADEFAPDADWLGVGFGATPRLCRFWADNGYRTVHLSTTRNERSGEYSALMLRPTSDRGWDLYDRHARRFRDRVGSVLADPLDDADPDVVRAALRATSVLVDPDLTDHEWRVVAAAAFGPGLYAAAPGAFRAVAVAALVEGDGTGLDADAERLLVRKALQGWEWTATADDLGYVSRRAAMRAFGDAFRPLVDRYGGTAAAREADRYRRG